MNSGIIATSLRSINHYLSPADRRQSWVQLLLLLVSSVLDVFGLATLVPVLLVAVEPGGVQKSKYFSAIYHYFGFTSDRNFLLVLIGLLLVFFLLKNLFSAWVNYLQARFTAHIGLSVVKSQLDKYLHFPFWNFVDLGSAQLINSTLQVPSTYVNMIVRPLFILLSEASIVVIILLGIMVYKPLLLGVLALVLAPSTLLTYRALRSRSQRLGNELNELRPMSFGIIGDIFNGFIELKLAGKHPQFEQKLVANQRRIQDLDAEAYLYVLLPVRVIEMIAILGVLTIFLYALLVPGASGSLLGLVGLFAAAAYRLMPSVNRILTSLVQLKQCQYTIDDLENFRTAEYQQRPHPQQLPLHFGQSLRLENLGFSFPGAERPALEHISLEVRKGEKIGFVGSSGSGKTTLMNVLLRFYIEQQGGIFVDGQPLTGQHLNAWHQLIGYVKQDTFLMEASIRDNITLASATVDEQRLDYAVQQASLQQFVASLPEGLDTMIGERGSKLSGGQRQRIGIARALDNETEREVNEAIARLAHTDITILLIAHRITTLKDCDRIYELSDGHLIAEHSYRDLIARVV
jgi:ABC-type multidrug transport system fused ATPase/permease subunit